VLLASFFRINFYIIRTSIMSYGGEGSGQSQTAVTVSDPCQEQQNQSHVRPYVIEVEQLVEHYRNGRKSKLEVIASITKFLLEDSELTSQEKTQSFELYMAEINSDERSRGERFEGVSSNRRNDEDVSRYFETGAKSGEHNGGGSNGGESSSSSESGEGEPRKRRKLQLSEMPWHGRPGVSEVSQNPSCVKTANIIRKFNRDLKSAKLYIRLAPGAPRGIPMSEWERIFKGEAVDLDKILSSLHRVTIDPERKASIGDTEISIGGSETKRKVESSSEWSTAWRSTSRAIAFVFEHRSQELAEYGDYIERLFAAKKSGSHGQVILFDKGVRNEVGGGQTILLTDYHYFTSLYAATLQDDGVEYRKGGRGRGGGTLGEPKMEVCLRFNSLRGCRFTESGCKYRHDCQGCGQTGHGKSTCTKRN
jgi:hypothetical protein